MCGRFTLTTVGQQLQAFFPLFDIPTVTPRYNIAPTQNVLVVRDAAEKDAKPQAAWMRWGLIPSWAKEKKIGASLINARADTVAAKPAFRAAFKRRRCLVLADGFYEWKKEPGNKTKQPFHIRRKDSAPFAFAGLWEHWEVERPAIESITIITTDANEVLKPLHDRMPVILDPHDYQKWIESSPKDPALLQELLQPCAPGEMIAVPVGTQVNNAKHEGPDCLARTSNAEGAEGAEKELGPN
ncbi:MAG: SOS response-associated peptidase [Planctomycetes bacterium]|nr:SOS response-associated peptidase [Planctomycetota bacterium]